MTIEYLTEMAGCAMRALGLLAVLPMGWELVGIAQRITLAAALAVGFVDPTIHQSTVTFTDLPVEFVIGCLLGFPAALFVEMAGMCGELFDAERGQTLASSYDPLQDQSMSVMAHLGKFGAWTFLLMTGGFITLVHGFAVSLRQAPVGIALTLSWAEVGMRALQLLPLLLSATFALMLPFAILCLLVEALTGLISRLVPGLSLSLQSFTVKTLLAFSLLGLFAQTDLGPALALVAQPVLHLVSR